MTSPKLTGHLLVAEDDRALASVLAEHLTALGHKVTIVGDGQAALSALASEQFDLALLDIVMPPPDGLEVLRALQGDPDAPAVIVATGANTIESAVNAMRLGAFVYLSKPYRMTELDLVITRALEHRVLTHQNAAMRAQLARMDGAHGFLTQYAPLAAVMASLNGANASADGPVLIVGAPGTGKRTLARAMHARSPRGARPFVVLGAGTLSSPDAERAIFGAVATPEHPAARAPLAGRGTVYLEDVGALRVRAQAALARSLRDSAFSSVGSAETRALRARVIGAALEVPQPSRVNADLIDALSATTVVLPPLRERAVDIPLLATSFLAAAAEATETRIDSDAMAALERHTWPGNVAELRAVIERARLVARGGVIRPQDLALGDSGAELELSEVERRHIVAVLDAKEWHQGKAAEALGISPKTLYRKIREYGLRRPATEEGP